MYCQFSESTQEENDLQILKENDFKAHIRHSVLALKCQQFSCLQQLTMLFQFPGFQWYLNGAVSGHLMAFEV